MSTVLEMSPEVEAVAPPTESQPKMSKLEKAKQEMRNILRQTSDPSRLLKLDAALHSSVKDKKNLRVTAGKGVNAAFEGLTFQDVATMEDADALRALYIKNHGDWSKVHLQNDNTTFSIVSGGKNAVATPEANEQASLEFLQERGYTAS